MLRLAEAAIVTTVDNLNLLAAGTIRAQQV